MTSGRRLVAARVAVTAILAYQALSFTAIAVNPQWNPLTRQLSEYALGHQGWLQAAAFLASAMSYAGLFTALRPHVHGASGRTGLGILAYCVLATTGVALFVTDPLSTPPAEVSVHGALHVLFGGTALILLPVAALLLTRNLARTNPRRSSSRRTLNRIAYLPLAGFALIWVPEVVGLLPAHGWPDRVVFLTYTAWVIAVAAPWSAGPTNPRIGRRSTSRMVKAAHHRAHDQPTRSGGAGSCSPDPLTAPTSYPQAADSSRRMINVSRDDR